MHTPAVYDMRALPRFGGSHGHTHAIGQTHGRGAHVTAVRNEMDGLTVEIVVGAVAVCAVLVAMMLLAIRKTERTKREERDGVKRVRQIGTFTARDGRGRLMTLIIYQRYFDAGTRDDPSAERKGPRQIMTADGRHVDKIATGKFRVLGSSDVLTSDDPDAP